MKKPLTNIPKLVGDTKPNSLFLVFKYVAIGSGILGVGFLIALIGLLLSH